MIAPLRRRHRWLAPACFAVSIGGLVLGAMARPDQFIAEGGGRDSVLVAPQAAVAVAQPVGGMTGLAVGVIRSEADDELQVWILAETRIEAADVLGYLSDNKATESLPKDARLLGAVAPLGATELTLPDGDGGPNLVLFSLAQQRVLVTVPLDKPTTEGR